MIELSPPVAQAHTSFLAAMAEFRAEGRGRPDDQTSLGREIREYSSVWPAPDGFARYVDWLLAQSLDDTPRPPGWVPWTTLWLIDSKEYLGRIVIRHWLTTALREAGGHIGYDVRPSARRRGHATAMLRAALPLACGLGVDLRW